MAVIQKQSMIAEKIRLFKEIGEVGVRNVALAFSERLGCDIAVENINAGILRVSTLVQKTGDPDNAAFGIFTRVNGPAPGHAAFLLPYHDALTLVDAVMGSPIGARKRFDELSTSALQEISRLFVCGQLSALEKVTGLRFDSESIRMAIDMAHHVAASMVADAGETDVEAMVVAARFERPDWSLEATFLFIPDAGSTDKLLNGASRALQYP